MQSIYLLILFLSSYPPLLHSAGDETKSSYLNCPPFYCNDKLDQIYFPFNNISNPECGIFTIKDCEPEQSPKTQLQRNNPIRWYGLDSVSQAVGMIPEVYINDPVLQNKIYRNDCSVLDDLALPRPTELLSVLPTSNRTLFKCKQTVRPKPPFPVKLDSTKCNGYEFYYSLLNNPTPDSPPENCSIINVPVHNNSICDDLFGETANLAAEFVLRLHVLPDCYSCYGRGGECKLNAQGKYYCTKSEDKKNNKTLKIALGIGLPAIFLCLVFGFCYYKRRRFTSYFRPRNSLTHTRSDLEADSACYGVPVFSYKELQEATSNFDQAREVGDGGFGTVYHGKLKDGREVAVKRLYQHNWRRVEQFINEIQILTCLRHKNLVSLYGCTSRHSRELLLVYEYIPNGTVADHLHGERADPSLLTWRIRMSIAIETASALSYLHASDIIHRDVKTNNILLDNNFCVKVADFGLSRLFPNYVTHVSTAPQGTPGYVDPEYNQCYQLTTKSDVYSFGVVLIELISSMLAVDITRHRHEINLSTMAIDKILQCKYDELVDPRLGFDSDSEVQRMIIEVAGLAFQCLQQAKESRPTMEEVLTALKGIESGNDELENHEVIHNSPNSYEIGLSKNMGHPLSPVSVADTWASCKSSANISG